MPLYFVAAEGHATFTQLEIEAPTAQAAQQAAQQHIAKREGLKAFAYVRTYVEELDKQQPSTEEPT